MKWYSDKVPMSRQKRDKIMAAYDAGKNAAMAGQPRVLPKHIAERYAYINGYADGQMLNKGSKRCPDITRTTSSGPSVPSGSS